MSCSPVTMESTQANQHLTSLRHLAFDNLCRVRGRSLKAADITPVNAGDQVTLIFKDEPILSLPRGYTRDELGRAMIRHLNAWNRAVLGVAKGILEDNVELPVDHTWRDQVGVLINDCWHDTSVSLYIAHVAQDMYRPDQFGIEFRMFPRECKGHLFMDYGPQHSFKARKLLEGNEPFVYASTPQAMAQELAGRFRIGLQRYRDSSHC